MRHYRLKIPPGLILPGLLGLILLIIIVSVGLVLFGIILAVLVVLGIGSAVYRALFSPKPTGDTKRYARPGIDDIPFTEYREIESGSGRNDHMNET